VVVVVVGKEEEGVTYSPVESGRNRRRRETVPAPSGILSIFPLPSLPGSFCVLQQRRYVYSHTPRTRKICWVKKKKKVFKKESTSERNTNTISESLLSYLSFLLPLLPSLAVGSSL
jgi:hypothetical protein